MDAIAYHLANHHGIITRSEARELGLTDRQIGHRVKAGMWERTAPGVFRLAGAPGTWHGRVRTAALSAGGIASHGTAATMHGIDGWDQTRIEIVVDQTRRPSPQQDITIHRSTQMHLAEVCEIHSVPVTGLARTVLDIAAVVGSRRLEWTVDAVLRSGKLDWPDLYAVWGRHSTHGRDGCGKLYALLERMFGDTAVPDSKFNRMIGQLLADAGINGFHYEYEILLRGRFLARADLAFPAARVVVECDSRRWHGSSRAFELDRTRNNQLAAAGWTVLNVTWKAYTETPTTIINAVYNVLKRKLGA